MLVDHQSHTHWPQSLQSLLGLGVKARGTAAVVIQILRVTGRGTLDIGWSGGCTYKVEVGPSAQLITICGEPEVPAMEAVAPRMAS